MYEDLHLEASIYTRYVCSTVVHEDATVTVYEPNWGACWSGAKP